MGNHGAHFRNQASQGEGVGGRGGRGYGSRPEKVLYGVLPSAVAKAVRVRGLEAKEDAKAQPRHGGEGGHYHHPVVGRRRAPAHAHHGGGVGGRSTVMDTLHRSPPRCGARTAQRLINKISVLQTKGLGMLPVWMLWVKGWRGGGCCGQSKCLYEMAAFEFGDTEPGHCHCQSWMRCCNAALIPASTPPPHPPSLLPIVTVDWHDRMAFEYNFIDSLDLHSTTVAATGITNTKGLANTSWQICQQYREGPHQFCQQQSVSFLSFHNLCRVPFALLQSCPCWLCLGLPGIIILSVPSYCVCAYNHYITPLL